MTKIKISKFVHYSDLTKILNAQDLDTLVDWGYHDWRGNLEALSLEPEQLSLCIEDEDEHGTKRWKEYRELAHKLYELIPEAFTEDKLWIMDT